MNHPVPESPWSAQRRASSALEVYLLGTVDFDSAVHLQNCFADDLCRRDDRMGAVLICEHPPTVTIGRSGTIADVQVDERELASRQIAFRRVIRGGGTLLHAPGQLAIYPILPLDRLGLDPAEHVRRLLEVVISVASEQRVVAREVGIDTLPARLDRTVLMMRDSEVCDDADADSSGPGSMQQVAPNFGQLYDPALPRVGADCRCGQFAWVGTSVRSGISQHGLFLNVSPVMDEQRLVRSVPTTQRIASLSMQRMEPIAMHKVREAVVRHLSERFEYSDFHIYTRHPLLQRTTPKVVDYVT